MSAAENRRPPAQLLHDAEGELLELAIEAQRADWVYATYVNDDTAQLSSTAGSRLIAATVRRARELASQPAGAFTPTEERKVQLLRLSLPVYAPSETGASVELTRAIASMEAGYATWRYAPSGTSEPIPLETLEKILFHERDPRRLEDVWTGWHRVGRTIRPHFDRYVALANRGAREMGFDDNGALWASKYEMAPEEFAREVERLWAEVRPLYTSLHAFVRRRLVGLYGPDVVPPDGPVPAHLLSNMWAQSWEGLYPELAQGLPTGGSDLTRALVDRKTGPLDMVRCAEGFFTSLGFEPLPASFWERSMFVRPRDREVVCHASAWDVDAVSDLRIKMCIDVTGEDFRTIHHELGHNFYQRAYAHQPALFRDGAHDGFHEAVGDTISLSITPAYLARIGLGPDRRDDAADLGPLLHRALEKVAFLPFGLVIDLWRWRVFSGAIAPDDYNPSWWALREKYQGIRPAAPRGNDEFDAGAKYHVPSNVPYMRYFLAHILQFQFHRALLRASGYSGPAHQGSIYGSTAAGAKLRAMLELGSSRPWPDALEAGTGERRMSADALLDYFAPLRRWLDEQNRGAPVGW